MVESKAFGESVRVTSNRSSMRRYSLDAKPLNEASIHGKPRHFNNPEFPAPVRCLPSLSSTTHWQLRVDMKRYLLSRKRNAPTPNPCRRVHLNRNSLTETSTGCQIQKLFKAVIRMHGRIATRSLMRQMLVFVGILARAGTSTIFDFHRHGNTPMTNS